MRRLELAVEKIILCSRYLLVVLYLGLGVGLAIFAAKFLLTLGELALGFTDLSKDQMILSMLVLIDWVLVGGLVVMVMLASYDNFVSRFDAGGGAEDLAWLGQLDHGSLKIKVASGIVAISAIHLLKIFIDVGKHPKEDVMWMTIIHGVFVASALILGVLDKLSAAKGAKAERP